MVVDITWSDILIGFLFAIVILGIGKKRSKQVPAYLSQTYFRNVQIKLLSSLIFSLVYLLIYRGGDTVAYFKTIECFNNLLIEDPIAYWNQIFNDYEGGHHIKYFTFESGIPPGWIFREKEGFFLCKILAVPGLLSLNSYFAFSFLISFWIANISWEFYNFIHQQYGLNKLIRFGILYMPSVNFWCTGISKDTIVLGLTLLMILGIMNYLNKGRRDVKSIFKLFLIGLILFQIRSFILIAILFPFGIVIVSRFIRLRIKTTLLRRLILFMVFLLSGLGLIQFMNLDTSEDEFLESNSFIAEAANTQQDFANNSIYGDKRYQLGDVEYTPVGMLKSAPMSIFAGIYRPLLTESLSLTLLFNGLESTFLLFLTLRFFKFGAGTFVRNVNQNDILLFSLIFVTVIAFVTGFTSVLFGVLVRLRTPLLPFFVLLLAFKYNDVKIERGDYNKR